MLALHSKVIILPHSKFICRLFIGSFFFNFNFIAAVSN